MLSLESVLVMKQSQLFVVRPSAAAPLNIFFLLLFVLFVLKNQFTSQKIRMIQTFTKSEICAANLYLDHVLNAVKWPSTVVSAWCVVQQNPKVARSSHVDRPTKSEKRTSAFTWGSRKADQH